MPLERHSLIAELPEFREQIHTLKTTDAHFAKLFDAYDALEHEVHRIESGVETVSDTHLEELKKKRLSLKDQLFGMLKSAA